MGGGEGMPGPPGSPTTLQQEMDDIVRSLNYLGGNMPDVSPDNTRKQNSRIIARKNDEKFVNQQVKQRQREISNLPNGIVNNRKSSMNFNFPETPPRMPIIRKEPETFKERSQDLDEIIHKLSKPSNYDENDQVTFEFEFFTIGVNPRFDSFIKRYGLTNENIQFVDFLQSDYCKEILQSNDLKIHVETGNIYTMILILTNLFLTL